MNLTPGTYLIELEFTRPVTLRDLWTAMRSLGFSKVVTDQSTVWNTTGALSASTSSLAKSSPLNAATSLSSVSTKAVSKTPSAVSKATQAATTLDPRTLAAVRQQSSPLPGPIPKPPSLEDAIKKSTAFSTISTSSKQAERVIAPPPTKPDAPKKLGKTVIKPKPKFSLPGGIESPGGGGGGGGGDGGGGSTSPNPTPTVTVDRAALNALLADPSMTPEDLESVANDLEKEGFASEAAECRARAAQLRALAAQGTWSGPPPGGGGDGGGGAGDVPTGVTPGVAPGNDTPPMPDEVEKIHILWATWKETGSPFYAPNTAGDLDDERERLQLVAHLSTSLITHDMDGMRWVSVTPLSINPLEDLTYQTHPYAIRTNQVYELRFLSYAKATPSRQAVAQTLEQMGWDVSSLIALKKDIRLPGKPRANMALWFSIARWMRPDSFIVSKDPFFFENVQPHPLLAAG